MALGFGQPIHLQIAFGAPLSSCDMSQASRNQHQGTLAVRERTNDSGAPPDLPQQPLQWVVGSQAAPVFRR
jgi:hypothetical protein